jgi:hypothetical protein
MLSLSGHLAMAGKSLKPSRGSPGRNLVRGPAAPQKARRLQRSRQALVSESESNTKYGVTAIILGMAFGRRLQVSGIRGKFGRGWRYVLRHEKFMECHPARKRPNW